MKKYRILHLIGTVVLAFIFAACSAPQPTLQTPAPPLEPSAPAPTSSPEPSPTPIPEKVLTVCLSEEPQSLYLYGSGTRSTWNVLEALYDGPIDISATGAEAVILEKIPSLADGDVQIEAVEMRGGDPIVDALGNYVALSIGSRVRPAGCASANCAITWDGIVPLQMERMSAEFRLKEGVNWSDGQPVRAADSVFSFHAAADPATPASKALVDRTASYEAIDERTVRWTGIPGYVAQRPEFLFWVPLPAHILSATAPAELLNLAGAAEKPLGWGPYILETWVKGESIRLVRNPNYFRASDGLPRYDALEFKFTGNPADSALENLVAGNCDVVDSNEGFITDLVELINTENNGRLKMLLETGPEWEVLAYGIRPAAYEDGYQPGTDRPDYFGDVRVRQAIGLCIDRAGMAGEFYSNRSSAPSGLIPAGAGVEEAGGLPAYDPAAGAALLQAAGWVDEDANPQTPRTAAAVAGVMGGTPLQLSLVTTSADLRQRAARQITANLQECGVGVTTQLVDPAQLFAPGPQGILFGRQFDLAVFSWAYGQVPACRLFMGDQVPSAQNLWTGVNVSGMNDREFDAACQAYLDQPQDAAAAAAAEAAFLRSMPALPLYYHLHVAITQPDLCGVQLDSTRRSLLNNLEGVDRGQACAQ